MPLSGNSGRNDLACLNPISQGIRLVDAFVHQANGVHKHLYLILRLRLYHLPDDMSSLFPHASNVLQLSLVCPRLNGHLLQVDRPFFVGVQRPLLADCRLSRRAQSLTMTMVRP